ncbi:MAG: tRNA lysidine(34) synthetase TilS [Clostridia bacterium]|nr:tRNA lysidine(34) synthetase TilS [Clostridia bacterium]
MKAELEKYRGLKICVAVSGGKDSVALLHYIFAHAQEYDISLSALNCDHAIRENSALDSEFVKTFCGKLGVPLFAFKREGRADISEAEAREWRLSCYAKAVESGADVIATAHHLNDNAETVLFNLARGSSVSGLEGITDGEVTLTDGKSLKIIHPLIECSRAEIDGYISKNNLHYVEDETNFTDDYTRNYIRHNVMPQLEKAVPQAAQAIYRLSRLAAEDNSYFDQVISNRNIITLTHDGAKIAHCDEKPVFKRAAVKVIVEAFNRKDYTAEHAERLYELQYKENGKKFGFLNLVAYKENGYVFLEENAKRCDGEIPYRTYKSNGFCGQTLQISTDKPSENAQYKILKFDGDKLTDGAVIRFAREGDRFTKFGGGTKSLGDYFTDRKIPVRLRKQIPLIADGNEILAVCGVEISDKIKITPQTRHTTYIVAADYEGEK